jgi:acetylornithine deacetylase/succinyl-diaminopimelate desuccinylase-like protein
VTRLYFERRARLEQSQTSADMLAIAKEPPDLAVIARLSKSPRYNAMMRTTCVATMLNAGHAPNALPQTAQANVNCRILPGHSPAETKRELERLVADPQITIEFVGRNEDAESKGFPTMAPLPDVMRPLEDVAGQMWRGAPVIPFMDTGASDSIYAVAAGIPSFGFNGIAIDQDDVRAHGKDERLRVSSYDEGVDFTYRFLKR